VIESIAGDRGLAQGCPLLSERRLSNFGQNLRLFIGSGCPEGATMEAGSTT